jgi:hypothetical protein
MVMKNSFRFVLAVFVLVILSNLTSAFNLTIYASLNNGTETFNSDFRVINQTGAATGLDAYDSLSPTLTSGYASFSSVLFGSNIHLGVDSWDAYEVRDRTLNLSFRVYPTTIGTLTLNWSMREVLYDAYLTYYGNDSNREESVSDEINMESNSSYSGYYSGEGYFTLRVVYYHPASDPIDSGNGGGTGPPRNELTEVTCNESLICQSWNVCQNLEYSFRDGLLSEKEYLDFKKGCNNKGYDTEICGFQIRTCEIIDKCVNSSLDPDLSQVCHYVSNPGCSDGVKNCHSGSCEILTDCGGPCDSCPSCSDEIKNQGEKGVDCGGPCPNQCTGGAMGFLSEIEGRQIVLWVIYILIAGAVFAAVLFIIYYIKRIKKRVTVDQYSWYNLK